MRLTLHMPRRGDIPRWEEVNPDEIDYLASDGVATGYERDLGAVRHQIETTEAQVRSLLSQLGIPIGSVQSTLVSHSIASSQIHTRFTSLDEFGQRNVISRIDAVDSVSCMPCTERRSNGFERKSRRRRRRTTKLIPDEMRRTEEIP